jgi:plasmid maintenance system antidote protein VapI
MEKLIEYLKNHTGTDLAARLDVHPSRLSQLKRGDKPSLDLAVKIERETDGYVNVNSWL